MVMDELVAVNPGQWPGWGAATGSPPKAGIGLGKGTLKVSACGVVAGVAPLASIWAVAEPARGIPGDTAAAADGQRRRQVHHRLIARDAEGLARGRCRRRQRGRGHGVVESDVAHWGARAEQLVGAGERGGGWWSGGSGRRSPIGFGDDWTQLGRRRGIGDDARGVAVVRVRRTRQVEVAPRYDQRQRYRRVHGKGNGAPRSREGTDGPGRRGQDQGKACRRNGTRDRCVDVDGRGGHRRRGRTRSVNLECGAARDGRVPECSRRRNDRAGRTTVDW